MGVGGGAVWLVMWRVVLAARAGAASTSTCCLLERLPYPTLPHRIVVEETHGNRRQLVLKLVDRSELPASEQMH